MSKFVAMHLARYGLHGTNNAPTPSGKPLTADGASGLPPLSRGAHLAFGFENRPFSRRMDPAERYWVQYGHAGRPARTFEEEIVTAVEEIVAAIGTCSVNAAGGYVSLLFATACAKADLDFELFAIDFGDEEGANPAVPRSRQRILQAEVEEFQAFATAFCELHDCTDAWVALDAFCASKAQAPYIFDGYDVRLENCSFDEDLRQAVAPPSWTLIDNEKFAAIPSWMAASGSLGVWSWLRWSPELIAAQLVSPEILAFLRSARAGTEGTRTAYNLSARLALARRVCGVRQVRSNLRASYVHSKVFACAERVSRTMRHLKRGHSTKHRYPLDRLLETFHSPLAGEFADDANRYGTVGEPEEWAAAGA